MDELICYKPYITWHWNNNKKSESGDQPYFLYLQDEPKRDAEIKN